MFIKQTSASIIVLVALIGSLQHAAQAFQVKDCAAGRDTDAKMLELDIDSCPDQSVDACVFIRGQNATMSLKFTPSKLSQVIFSLSPLQSHILNRNYIKLTTYSIHNTKIPQPNCFRKQTSQSTASWAHSRSRSNSKDPKTLAAIMVSSVQ
jgi:hypothetical protein